MVTAVMSADSAVTYTSVHSEARSWNIRAEVPDDDTPPRKRLLLTTPRPGCEIGESSAAA
ncbi:hypothetical protein Tco_0283563, partial [Tanacetum coccineum]